MALSGTAITVTYFAWDIAANAGKTGDASNHTVRVDRDGSQITPSGSPVQVDATNCPGLYRLTLTANEHTGHSFTLHGKSATANVVIIPTFWTTDNGATLSAQAIRDAMKLAPSAGDPAAGSIDKHLDDVPTAATIAGAVLDEPVTGHTGHLAATLTAARVANLDNLDVAVSAAVSAAEGAQTAAQEAKTAAEALPSASAIDTQLSSTHGAGSWEGGGGLTKQDVADAMALASAETPAAKSVAARLAAVHAVVAGAANVTPSPQVIAYKNEDGETAVTHSFDANKNRTVS